MEHEQRIDKPTGIEGHFARYEVYDRDGEKIGKVDDLFVDDNDRPEYVGVKIGLLGTRSTLIPMENMRIDEGREILEVDQPKSVIKDGPTFDDNDEEITPELEERVRNYYGMGSSQEPTGRRAYDDYHGDEDELRVQRSEEELRAGTREREAGKLKVRKRVRTEREQVRVPKRREEIEIERVPGKGKEASEAEIGEEEIVVQVFEEEVVVSKRTVLKEEIRIRKKVVEDEEVVEVDLRKEEVDIEDSTERRGGNR